MIIICPVRINFEFLSSFFIDSQILKFPSHKLSFENFLDPIGVLNNICEHSVTGHIALPIVIEERGRNDASKEPVGSSLDEESHSGIAVTGPDT